MIAVHRAMCAEISATSAIAPVITTPGAEGRQDHEHEFHISAAEASRVVSALGSEHGAILVDLVSVAGRFCGSGISGSGSSSSGHGQGAVEEL